MPRVASKGAKLTDFITSKWVNNLNKRHNVPSQPPQLSPENPIRIGCLGATGKTFARFAPATISAPLLDYEDFGDDLSPQHQTLKCKITDALVENNWGIVQGPCDEETSSSLVLSGLTWATFEVTDTNHTHVQVDGTDLTSSTSGRAQIIHKESGTAPYTTIGLINLIPVGASGGTKIVYTPGGGIAARSSITPGSATCTEYKISSGDLVTNTTTLTVYNIWPVAIPASYYILATIEEATGQWIANFPGIVDVRWDDPDLEQTLDGSTYTNIDTAVDCT